MINSNLTMLLASLGIIYSANGLRRTILRGLGRDEVDPSHRYEKDKRKVPPSQWIVDQEYHLPHHLDTGNAYFSGVIPIFDKIIGTARSYKNKTVAVTGANGVLGKALIEKFLSLGAKKVIALTTNENASLNFDSDRVRNVVWQAGKENNLLETIDSVHVLILAHGIKPDSFDADSIAQAFEVNVVLTLRLAEVFLQTIKTDLDVALKELWITTSEAEVIPVNSPAYEASKQQLGHLTSLIRLQAPCIVRKLILGAYSSPMSPNAKTDVADIIPQILFYAKRDRRNIIVSRNLLVHLLVPLKEALIFWLYRR